MKCSEEKELGAQIGFSEISDTLSVIFGLVNQDESNTSCSEKSGVCLPIPSVCSLFSCFRK